MRISDVLRNKGTDVYTVRPDTPVREFLSVMVERRIGACVLSSDGVTVAGIVSERDIARALHDRGADILAAPVSEIATSDVHTCHPEESLDELTRVMTERRVRHIPVLVDGRLAGLVSIGDIVKHRMDELETERQALVDYISSAG
ncbi:CBS domain-containing protein [Sporichthya brevicatena]|uniref:CBS domain-containing protein n=1 Tax=Sporichthya brevicatena TaxID=171442 RepID=A0ABN1GHU7_9ACTN